MCDHRVLAVLFDLHERKIIDLNSQEWTQLSRPEVTGATRTRREVLAAIDRMLDELFSNGTARVNHATVNRLTTLSVSAHGADLPRVERALAGLSDAVQRIVKRDAGVDTAEVLGRGAQLLALSAALKQQETVALIGQHRTEYANVGSMVLVGMAAQVWQTAGGFHGLTTYFWSDESRRWFTWSESRPIRQAGFSPKGCYQAPGPWEGCLSPHEASRNVWQLSGAWRNRNGRISGRSSTLAVLTRSRSLDEHDFVVDDWAAVIDRLQNLNRGGLQQPPPHAELLVLQPAKWEQPLYDDVRQELRWDVYDKKGRRLTCRIPFQSASKKIDTFEALSQSELAERSAAFLGKLVLRDRRLFVEPISVYVGEDTINLGLDRRGAKKRSSGQAVGPEEVTTAPSGSGVSRLLDATLACFELLAERGTKAASRRELEQMDQLAKRYRDLGLNTIATALSELKESNCAGRRGCG